MVSDDIPHVTCCFRCGEFGGDYNHDPNSALQLCKSCGEFGIVTVQQAMDILNQLVLEGSIVMQDISEVGYTDE